MEYRKRRRQTINTQVNDLEKVYPHDLQMYTLPPGGELQFMEFQSLGFDRLKLLREIENNGLRDDFKSLEDRKTHLEAALIKEGLKYFARLLQATGCKLPVESDLQARRKDHISHFIMRLSCANDPDQMRWFINQEVEFFRLRFNSLQKEGIEHLLKLYKIKCQQITKEEREELREELRVSTPKIVSVDTTEFYKVSFRKVPDLVKSRRVFLKNGQAYVSQVDLVSLFVTYFRQILTKGMQSALQNIEKIVDDTRLTSFLFALPASFSGMTRIVWSTTETPIEKLDELSKVSYPLCMRVMHETLRTHHHLKNSGRMQYGLFIKGIGVPLEDALRFWRAEFTKKIDSNKFDKEYAYSIRHTYGKEGKQTNYTPFSCGKIIQSSVAPGEYHGCPFKHMDSESLKQKLMEYGAPVPSIAEMASLAKEGHYTLACTKYFETLHKRLPERPINHPNSYYAESRKIFTKDDDSENVGRQSQPGKINDRVMSTPSRSIDRGNFTPLRPSNDSFNGSPSLTKERIGTPLRKSERPALTPVRRLSQNIPKKIEANLNDDQIAMLMDEY